MRPDKSSDRGNELSSADARSDIEDWSNMQEKSNNADRFDKNAKKVVQKAT
jgi:hypothetical protein